MSFTGMLPLHLATVDLSPVGERLFAASGLAVTVLAALWYAWTRPVAQPVPVRVSSRRNPRR
ncbi:hypothetical protein OWM54_21020 [Myxococcus sp. MISCRS1]|jgi:hypothetical protein|uniref:hypothetical protein n=1 Tax=Myxococcus TaxID=32 RepID=UPI001CC085C1|nr:MULTISPECIES: hypothetical protein [Myxococcus]BDT38775.1 hypothetical protein MFMH1_84440 [Myxococcus sp. MH1]MBZ4399125.1 hypothetical protein [Myxococcus sp. AS-1-15]MBZ4413279.1 hypothetical protein [Myxococcus sp. XM-1-1-1]MCP3063460.1 hypothetical protein [Myxococcus guangdongensis]MCY0999620.1 hypothetical protein [Myxococcus sp. MISCRS1]